MAAKWRLPGLRYFVVTSRADTRPVFLAPGQNSILYVKQMSNFHWEDRAFFAHLNKIDWNKSCYRKNSTEKVSVPGKGRVSLSGVTFAGGGKEDVNPRPPSIASSIVWVDELSEPFAACLGEVFTCGQSRPRTPRSASTSNNWRRPCSLS